MIAKIQDSARKLGRMPTTRELKSMTGLTPRMVVKRFGSFTLGLDASGLVRQDRARPHTMMELFLGWATITRKLQRVPTTTEFHMATLIAEACLIRRFQRWGLVPMGMRLFMEKEGLETECSPHLL